jgi:hypothetical protein
MKASSSPHPPGAGPLGDGEPAPLPPPPIVFEDDHYFDDDEQPSWWSAIRPLSAVQAAGPRPRELEVLRPAARRRARTADDEACATAHVLRIRARLLPDEQRAFDELMGGPAATDIVTMLVNRSEDDAVEKLRRRLDEEPSAAEASRRALAVQIAALSALLSPGEQATARAALGSLWPEELLALHARLAGLPAPEAAALIRTYLAPRR